MNEAADNFEISLETRVQHVRDTLTPPYIAMLRERAMKRLGMHDTAADRLVDTAISNFAVAFDDRGFATMLGFADIRKVVKKDVETRVLAAQEHRQLEDDVSIELEEAIERMLRRKKSGDNPPGQLGR